MKIEWFYGGINLQKHSGENYLILPEFDFYVSYIVLDLSGN